MDKNCTEKLMNILKDLHSVSALTEYVSSLEEIRDPDAYLDYFLSLPEVKTLGKAEVIRRSGLDRTYCYQILNGRKKAGRRHCKDGDAGINQDPTDHFTSKMPLPGSKARVSGSYMASAEVDPMANLPRETARA